MTTQTAHMKGCKGGRQVVGNNKTAKEKKNEAKQGVAVALFSFAMARNESEQIIVPFKGIVERRNFDRRMSSVPARRCRRKHHQAL
jgi:hypothetical protein